MDSRLVALVLLLSLASSGLSCPSRCLCFRTTVRCMFLQLGRVPLVGDEVPEDTTILDLRFNRIRDIPPGAFKGLIHLHTLLLNNNHIQKIEPDAFEGLSKLKYLYLYKNEIDQVGEKAFQGLKELEQLYIHFNNIEELLPKTFVDLPALERLFLHNNNIKTLPKGVFSDLHELKRLRLDSNALVCDCNMMWLSEMLKDMKSSTQAAATCGFPSSMEGKSLLAVDMEDLDCRKPSFTLEPSDVEVSFGNTAYLYCRAEGDPQPDIIWRHNKHELETNQIDERGRHQILEDGTLMIENAQESDKGVYECVARNVAGEVTARTAELRYRGEPVVPVLLAEPEDKTVLRGDSFILSCTSSGDPTPEVTWSHDLRPVDLGGRITQLASGALQVTGALLTDRGEYRCSATNSLGEATATAVVEVQVSPTFIERPQGKDLVHGQTAVFNCKPDGNPTPQITWAIDGRPVSERDPRYRILDNGERLEIPSVAPSDQGLYGCYVENAVGRREASAQLRVKSRVPPAFVRTPRNVRGLLHGPVRLECSASGDPPPIIRWYKQDASVVLDGRIIQEPQGDLVIFNVTDSDESIYECRAANSDGSVQAYARLNVRGNPRESSPPSNSRQESSASTRPSDTVEGNRPSNPPQGNPQRPLNNRPNGPFVGNRFVNNSIQEAIREVDSAIDNTNRELRDPNRKRTPSDLLALFRLPSRGALEVTRAAEIYERTLEIVRREIRKGHEYDVHFDQPYEELISPDHLVVIANLSGCAAHRRISDCSELCYHKKYRTYDGTCNNLKNPMWGASLTPLNRMIKPRYENGINTPPGWNITRLYNGHLLPSARRLSLKLASAEHITQDETYTHMVMQWGQFLDHDMTFTPMAVSNARFSDGRHCNETCDNQAPCFPIAVAADDPRIHRHRCIGVARSSAMCGSGMTSVFMNTVTTREQISQITAYIDASNVYGSSEEEAYDLRDFSQERGYLRVGRILPSGRALLPPNLYAPVDCQMDPNNAHIPCFQAGDHRANEQLGLLSMHTVWMREHNRIARELLTHNPHWDGDMLFHEARKIVGAEMQHISYSHWLPKVIGPRGMEMLGEYKGYNASVDASIINAFSTAAFRFGHTLINPIIGRLDENHQPIPEGNLPLHKAFFAPFRIVEEGGIDPILRGLFALAAKKPVPGELLNTELTEKLFKLAHAVALDLAALNIQRGRDHGLPSYNEYRRQCGLQYASTFDDLAGEITSTEIRRKLGEEYGHPGNIDLWLGGLLEEMAPGARVGPTFRCILVEQFTQIRDGDRFWYENPDVFNRDQITEIRLSSLARVLCDNADKIGSIQKDVFTMVTHSDEYLNCNSEEQIPKVNTNLWTHCCSDCSKSGEFNSLTSHVFRRRRSSEFSFPDERPQGDMPHGNHLNDVLKEKPQYTDHTDHKKELPNTIFTHSSDQSSHDDNFLQTESDVKNMVADLIDSRIEGVEDVMAHMEKTLYKMNRKIKKLQRGMIHHKKGSTYCLDSKKKKVPTATLR